MLPNRWRKGGSGMRGNDTVIAEFNEALREVAAIKCTSCDVI